MQGSIWVSISPKSSYLDSGIGQLLNLEALYSMAERGGFEPHAFLGQNTPTGIYLGWYAPLRIGGISSPPIQSHVAPGASVAAWHGGDPHRLDTPPDAPKLCRGGGDFRAIWEFPYREIRLGGKQWLNTNGKKGMKFGWWKQS